MTHTQIPSIILTVTTHNPETVTMTLTHALYLASILTAAVISIVAAALLIADLFGIRPVSRKVLEAGLVAAYSVIMFLFITGIKP